MVAFVVTDMMESSPRKVRKKGQKDRNGSGRGGRRINMGKEKQRRSGVDVCAGVLFWSRMRGSPLRTDRMISGNA